MLKKPKPELILIGFGRGLDKPANTWKKNYILDDGLDERMVWSDDASVGKGTTSKESSWPGKEISGEKTQIIITKLQTLDGWKFLRGWFNRISIMKLFLHWNILLQLSLSPHTLVWKKLKQSHKWGCLGWSGYLAVTWTGPLGSWFFTTSWTPPPGARFVLHVTSKQQLLR